MTNRLLFNVTGTDQKINELLEKNIAHFFDELDHYIISNKDYGALEYANEQTLACMYVNGIIRNDKDKRVSALQEYGTEFEIGKSCGRPDIFLRIDDTAFLIECKYDKTKNIGGDHWNIENWLSWDREKIFNQALAYYKAENLNSTYKGGCYVISMAFKLIINADNHSKNVNEHMMNTKTQYDERDWYYCYGIPASVGVSRLGLEVYGTFKKMPPPGKNYKQENEVLNLAAEMEMAYKSK